MSDWINYCNGIINSINYILTVNVLSSEYTDVLNTLLDKIKKTDDYEKLVSDQITHVNPQSVSYLSGQRMGNCIIKLVLYGNENDKQLGQKMFDIIFIKHKIIDINDINTKTATYIHDDVGSFIDHINRKFTDLSIAQDNNTKIRRIDEYISADDKNKDIKKVAHKHDFCCA